MPDIRISSQQNVLALDPSLQADAPLESGQQEEISHDLVAHLQLEGQRILAQMRSGAPDLEPPHNGKADSNEVNGALEQASVQLYADIFQFMALFMKFAQEMRQTARLDREMTLQSQVSALQAAADEMREAAASRFNAALAQGICQIGAGAIQMGGAAYSGYKAYKASGTYDVSSKGEHRIGFDTQSGQEMLKRGDTVRLGAEGVGSLANGTGTIARGSMDKEASEHDAKRSDQEAASRIHEAAREKAKETMDMMMDIIRDIRDKLAAMEQSNVEANRGIARNI
ncbi:type III secretion system translocon subunit SctB [Chitinimonas lacunae]|uniref:Type III secretion system translocon subunit SctB n=1 Tax=Chitinimonas lacunae TaxID=1963018 RepID=A0ABV8MPT5_9NEIS